MYEKRENKGLELAIKGHVIQVNSTEFEVVSENANGTYRVSWGKKRWVCTCPDFVHKRKNASTSMRYAISLHFETYKRECKNSTTEKNVQNAD